MPPKNKKDLEEEAKRLEQQQKRKQEEERQIQEQRKKYAAQKISTGLILPVSTQLIVDFASQQSAFIVQKLKEVLTKQFETLKDERTLKQLCRQILFYINNLRKMFQLNHVKPQDSQEKFFKVRVVCGLFLSLYLNNHQSISEGSTKNKEDDENLLKRLLISHSQSKAQTQQKVFNKNEIIMILSYFKDHYFSHFLVLHKSNIFPKRQDQKIFTIYVSSPSVEFNTVQTTFVDLSGNKQEAQHSDNNEDKKSDE